MLVSWDADVSWTTPARPPALACSATTSRPGPRPTRRSAGLGGAGTRTFTSNGLKATVQAWANGAPNNGWAARAEQQNDWNVRSSEDASVAYRPRLQVRYQAPVGTVSYTGAGVTVAIIDSGVKLTRGQDRVKTTPRLHDGQRQSRRTSTDHDGYGHGTHIAGLIGSNEDEAEGVAPGVQFVSLRVLDDNGAGYTSDVIKALEWAVPNRAAYGIDVINMSLGHPIYEPAATRPAGAGRRGGGARRPRRRGLGRQRRHQSRDPGVVGLRGHHLARQRAVGASRSARPRRSTRRGVTDDVIADYSSRGPTWYDTFVKPDVVAPGHNLFAQLSKRQQYLFDALPLKQLLGSVDRKQQKYLAPQRHQHGRRRGQRQPWR